jgi:bifunctional non-homologous end joining protein LigD
MAVTSALKKDEVYLKVEGKVLKFTHRNRLLYPQAGFTKWDVIQYYRKMAPFILPHLAGRPLTLKRYPGGVDQPFFYEKRCPSHRPSWLKVSRGSEIQFCLSDDLPSLMWLANLASIELHAYLAKSSKISQPDFIAFDLDPGAPATVEECCQVALELKMLFESLGLRSFAKTSGSKGLQIYVPLNTPTDYEQTKNFSHRIALLLEMRCPDRVVSRMTQALRSGKVLIDWSQNSEHKTTVCAYSLRALAHPTVSTPILWKEVKAGAGDGSRIYFEAHDVLKRVKKHGDLFKPVLELKQKLPAMAALYALNAQKKRVATGSAGKKAA